MWHLYVRFFSVVVLGVYAILRHRKLKESRARRRSERNATMHFKKNEEGLYPWEADTDNSPKRISPNTPRFVEKERIRRGHWHI